MSKLHNAGKKSKNSKKRNKSKFPGLKPENHPRIRAEYIDMDYIKDLSDTDKAMLGKFIDEYYGATLAPADKRWKWDNDFHNKKKSRKACMDRVNALNRDLFAQARIRGFIEPTESLPIEKTNNPLGHEDLLIDLIDLKNKDEKL